LPIITSNKLHLVTFLQWHRTVVKYGGRGQSGQSIKLFQAPQKLVLPSIFDTGISFSLM